MLGGPEPFPAFHPRPKRRQPRALCSGPAEMTGPRRGGSQLAASPPQPGGERTPPPGAPRAPSRTQLFPPHCALPARALRAPPGSSPPSPGKRPGQFRSRPRVRRSAGPGRRRVGAAGQQWRGEKRGAAGAHCASRLLPGAAVRRAPALPPRSAAAGPCGPYILAGPRRGGAVWAGRGEGAAGGPHCFLGGVVPST